MIEDLEVHNKYLYVGILFISCMLVLIALGPGIFGMDIYESRLQYIFFENLCHQDPIRSYSVGGVSMAVCARCFGIYTAFAVSLLGAFIFEQSVAMSKKTRVRMLLGAICINAFDVLGNAFGIWDNTLLSRLIVGAAFGCSVAILITDEFFKKTTKSEDTYGTEYAA